MNNKKNSGSCLCGEVSFEIVGEFERFFLCHCKYCQKDTGSAYAANLFSTKAELRWTSGHDKITNYRLINTRHSKSFCSICGSALPNLQNGDKFLVVPAGSLENSLTMRPNSHIFISSKADWEKNLEKLKTHESLPEE